jgi:hypothetical protein
MGDIPGIFYKDKKPRSATSSQKELQRLTKAKKDYAAQVRHEAKVK